MALLGKGGSLQRGASVSPTLWSRQQPAHFSPLCSTMVENAFSCFCFPVCKVGGNDGPCLRGLMSRSNDFTQGKCVRTVLVPNECSMSAAVVTLRIIRVFGDRGEPEIPTHTSSLQSKWLKTWHRDDFNLFHLP